MFRWVIWSCLNIASKLKLGSASPIATVSIVAKAIHDGAVDVARDHSNGWKLRSSDIR